MNAGKAALVTGAADRLGRAMALSLANRGYAVAVHYNKSEAKALETVELARKSGAHAVAVQADLLDEDAALNLVERSRKKLECELSVLVNNASIFENDTLVSADREGWDRHMEANLRVPFVLIQAFARQVPNVSLDEQDEPVASGVVVNLVDHWVVRPTAEFTCYTLSKMGLWSLTRIAALSLAPSIRVNAIGPGPTLRTPTQREAHFEGMRRSSPLGRGTDLDDIVSALHYVLDSNALTGQLLCIDAGRTLMWNAMDLGSVN